MATAGLTATGFESKQSQAAIRGANPENFNVIFSGHSMREPRRMIYVHTVAKRTLPPLSRALFPKLTLKACEEGERYVTCCAIPDPVPQAVQNEMNGDKDIKEHDGWRAAIDLLNPGNLSRNPFAGTQNPDFFLNRNGQNLIALGYWPSLEKEPPEAEIKLAEKHRDANYRYLTREAVRLAAVSTKDLNEFLQTYPDTHIAMDALGLEANWHTLNVIKASCPNCGDAVKQGIAFHQSSTGILCIIDPARALKAGAINRERYQELTEDEGEAKKRSSRMKPIV
jgi:hypothetical protein